MLDEEFESMWREYFVFTVVRNPLARAISSYTYMAARIHRNESNCPQVSAVVQQGFSFSVAAGELFESPLCPLS